MSEADFVHSSTTPGTNGKAAEKPKGEGALLRGALKLEASTSTPVVSAGTEFSIYVVIRNPFPVPVTIHSTETHIPIELSDEIWRKEERLKTKEVRTKQINDMKPGGDRVRQKIRFWFTDLLAELWPDPGPRVAVAVSPEVQKAVSSHNNIIYFNAATQPITIEGNVSVGNWDLDFVGLSPEEVRQMLFDINEYVQGRSPVILNAGDSVVKHFVLKTTHWLTFTPIAHTFQIQVRYEVDGQTHVDTVPFSLNIRAATASSMIGAMIGSALGSLVSKKFIFTDSTQFAVTMLTASIFAMIIVVAFARANSSSIYERTSRNCLVLRHFSQSNHK